MAFKSGNKPVTQVEFESGLKRMRTELKGNFANTRWQMTEVEERLGNRMDAIGRDVNAKIDAFLSKLETYGRESVTLPKTLDNHGKTLQDHEERLTRLESAKS